MSFKIFIGFENHVYQAFLQAPVFWGKKMEMLLDSSHDGQYSLKGKKGKRTPHYQVRCLGCLKVLLKGKVESSLFSLKEMLTFSKILLLFSCVYLKSCSWLAL